MRKICKAKNKIERVCILSKSNVKHMTLISHYTRLFDLNNTYYDIIYVDKYGEREKTNAIHQYAYLTSVDPHATLIKKIVKYFGFRKFAKRIIKKNNYDFIVVWDISTALLFPLYLAIKKGNQYCLNIRDYFMNNNIVISFFTWLLVKNSRFTTISSKGYLEFLPRHDYFVLHSLNPEMLNGLKPRKHPKPVNDPIRISFIGNVRFYERNFELIDALANDKRFILQYFGKGAKLIGSYVEEKGINNVVCLDSFEPSETPKLLSKTDIINNLYGYGIVSLDTAISIRLYYAAYMNVPILVFHQTLMSNVSNEFGLGIEIRNIQLSTGDYIYEKYHRMKPDQTIKKAKKFLEKIKQENEIFYDYFQEFL